MHVRVRAYVCTCVQDEKSSRISLHLIPVPYLNVLWESDQSIGTSAHAHLHYQHVISVHALSSKVTHVANQPRLATPCLPHDDNRDTTPEYEWVCARVCVYVGE